MTLPFSPGGHVVALAATAVSGLANARRALRAQVLADAADVAVPDSYVCAVWIGSDEIALGAEVIRSERPRMESDPNPFDDLEYALSECASIGKPDDPPVLLLGVVAVTAAPARLP